MPTEKTLQVYIGEPIHELLKDTQAVIRQKTGMRVTLRQIVELSIKHFHRKSQGLPDQAGDVVEAGFVTLDDNEL